MTASRVHLASDVAIPGTRPTERDPTGLRARVKIVIRLRGAPSSNTSSMASKQSTTPANRLPETQGERLDQCPAVELNDRVGAVDRAHSIFLAICIAHSRTAPASRCATLSRWIGRGWRRRKRRLQSTSGSVTLSVRGIVGPLLPGTHHEPSRDASLGDVLPARHRGTGSTTNPGTERCDVGLDANGLAAALRQHDPAAVFCVIGPKADGFPVPAEVAVDERDADVIDLAM